MPAAGPPDAEPRPPARAADRRAGARRADVLAVVRDTPRGIGIRALAEVTGLHENTVRFHLDRLVADGLVERRTVAAGGPGRPPLTFVARRDHHGAGHDNYELLARVLAAQLADRGEEAAAAAAEAAGRAWGRARPVRHGAPPGAPTADPWDEALDELTRTLDRAGFAPEVTGQVDGSSATVEVHRCPFLHLAREDRAVPCAVHLGLMEGVLEAAGSTVVVERLEPFVTPTLCVAHLRATSPDAPDAPGGTGVRS